MRWAILGVLFAGCGQAAAVAPVVTQVSAPQAAAAPVSNFNNQTPIDNIPPEVTPKGWQVTFTSGILAGQTQLVPRYIPSDRRLPIDMSGYGGGFGERLPVSIAITPAGSRLVLTYDGGASSQGGAIIVPGGGLSFSGSGTWVHQDGTTSGFSADVVAIP